MTPVTLDDAIDDFALRSLPVLQLLVCRSQFFQIFSWRVSSLLIFIVQVCCEEGRAGALVLRPEPFQGDIQD